MYVACLFHERGHDECVVAVDVFDSLVIYIFLVLCVSAHVSVFRANCVLFSWIHGRLEKKREEVDN